MSVYEILTNPQFKSSLDMLVGLFLGGSTLIQIAPIKLNPWDAILGWIGKGINRGLSEEVQTLRKEVNDMWVSEHRRRILAFARECRKGTEHSMEEWRFVIAQMEEYENYCRRNEVDNGVVKEDSAYVRGQYHKLLEEHKL